MQTNLKETVFLTTFLGNGFTNWKTNQNTHLGFALDAIAAIPQARSILCQSACFLNNLKYKHKNWLFTWSPLTKSPYTFHRYPNSANRNIKKAIKAIKILTFYQQRRTPWYHVCEKQQRANSGQGWHFCHAQWTSNGYDNDNDNNNDSDNDNDNNSDNNQKHTLLKFSQIEN